MPSRRALVLLWFIGLLGTGGIQAETIAGTVISVHDGDSVTLLASDGQRIKIRLAGIDAPELTQPFGRESKNSLIALVLGKVVIAAIRTQDRYPNRTERFALPGRACGRGLRVVAATCRSAEGRRMFGSCVLLL